MSNFTNIHSLTEKLPLRQNVCYFHRQTYNSKYTKLGVMSLLRTSACPACDRKPPCLICFPELRPNHTIDNTKSFDGQNTQVFWVL